MFSASAENKNLKEINRYGETAWRNEIEVQMANFDAVPSTDYLSEVGNSINK